MGTQNPGGEHILETWDYVEIGSGQDNIFRGYDGDVSVGHKEYGTLGI